MQPTGTFWTTLEGDHPGIIPPEEKFFKEIGDGRTDGLTMDFVLRWAKTRVSQLNTLREIREIKCLYTHNQFPGDALQRK